MKIAMLAFVIVLGLFAYSHVTAEVSNHLESRHAAIQAATS